MKNRNAILMVIVPVLACFALLPGARAVSPAPDGCFPNFTTAEGCDALSLLTIGAGNTALGWRSLFLDTTGSFNTGVGGGALALNNAAIGNQALQSTETTIDHVVIGRMAGSGITTVDNNIIIGHHSGVHTVFGQVSDRCTIDNISGAPVSAATAAVVMVDSDGRLGTVTSDGPDLGGFSPKGGIRPQAIPDAAKQAMLDQTVESLQATISQQQNQIETLTAQLKENAAQIQKANDQLEMNKPATKMVVNKP